jgi:hypothetical protein
MKLLVMGLETLKCTFLLPTSTPMKEVYAKEIGKRVDDQV